MTGKSLVPGCEFRAVAKTVVLLIGGEIDEKRKW